MNLIEWGQGGLFIACFLSATVIPFPSEAVVVYFLTQDQDSAFWILVIATSGNSLGGVTTYLLGRLGNKVKKVQDSSRALKLVQKYGVYSALLSWVPIIGDPVLLLLGYFRSPYILTLILMFTGKFARYLALFFLISQ